MKSTIKIDYERSYENEPILKIVTKRTLVQKLNSPNFNEEEDVRDKLVKDFLHSPMKMERNFMFELKTYFNVDDEDFATIGPVKYENMLYKIRHIILNRFVEYNDLVIFNSRMAEGNELYRKIHSFFDWLDNLEKENNTPKEEMERKIVSS